MAIRKIFTDNAPCLYKTARPVEKFDEKLTQLLDDMAETMYHSNGVGLAAPQVGILRRVFVIDVGDGLIEFVNPKIVSFSGVQGDYEGCLSFPNRDGYVERPMNVIIQAYDRNADLHQYKAEGLFARAIFHENDHLDGKVYLRLVKEAPEGFDKKKR